MEIAWIYFRLLQFKLEDIAVLDRDILQTCSRALKTGTSRGTRYAVTLRSYIRQWVLLPRLEYSVNPNTINGREKCVTTAENIKRIRNVLIHVLLRGQQEVFV